MTRRVCSYHRRVIEHTGSIESGKTADLVLLRDDPLQDISAVRHPVMVIKGNKRFDPNALYEAVGIKPFN